MGQKHMITHKSINVGLFSLFGCAGPTLLLSFVDIPVLAGEDGCTTTNNNAVIYVSGLTGHPQDYCCLNKSLSLSGVRPHFSAFSFQAA